MRDLEFVGSSLDDLSEFPEGVKHDVGVALMDVQYGATPTNATLMKGFGGASVLEIVERYDGDTYRAVYTVRFETAVSCVTAARSGGSSWSRQYASSASSNLLSMVIVACFIRDSLPPLHMAVGRLWARFASDAPVCYGVSG